MLRNLKDKKIDAEYFNLLMGNYTKFINTFQVQGVDERYEIASSLYNGGLLGIIEDTGTENLINLSHTDKPYLVKPLKQVYAFTPNVEKTSPLKVTLDNGFQYDVDFDGTLKIGVIYKLIYDGGGFKILPDAVVNVGRMREELETLTNQTGGLEEKLDDIENNPPVYKGVSDDVNILTNKMQEQTDALNVVKNEKHTLPFKIFTTVDLPDNTDVIKMQLHSNGTIGFLTPANLLNSIYIDLRKITPVEVDVLEPFTYIDVTGSDITIDSETYSIDYSLFNNEVNPDVVYSAFVKPNNEIIAVLEKGKTSDTEIRTYRTEGFPIIDVVNEDLFVFDSIPVIYFNTSSEDVTVTLNNQDIVIGANTGMVADKLKIVGDVNRKVEYSIDLTDSNTIIPIDNKAIYSIVPKETIAGELVGEYQINEPFTISTYPTVSEMNTLSVESNAVDYVIPSTEDVSDKLLETKNNTIKLQPNVLIYGDNLRDNIYKLISFSFSEEPQFALDGLTGTMKEIKNITNSDTLLVEEVELVDNDGGFDLTYNNGYSQVDSEKVHTDVDDFLSKTIDLSEVDELLETETVKLPLIYKEEDDSIVTDFRMIYSFDSTLKYLDNSPVNSLTKNNIIILFPNTKDNGDINFDLSSDLDIEHTLILSPLDGYEEDTSDTEDLPFYRKYGTDGISENFTEVNQIQDKGILDFITTETVLKNDDILTFSGFDFKVKIANDIKLLPGTKLIFDTIDSEKYLTHILTITSFDKDDVVTFTLSIPEDITEPNSLYHAILDLDNSKITLDYKCKSPYLKNGIFMSSDDLYRSLERDHLQIVVNKALETSERDEVLGLISTKDTEIDNAISDREGLITTRTNSFKNSNDKIEGVLDWIQINHNDSYGLIPIERIEHIQITK